MSIIERVAEPLGPIEQGPIERSNSKSSASSGELDPIERAVRERTEHSQFPEAREDAAREAGRPHWHEDGGIIVVERAADGLNRHIP